MNTQNIAAESAAVTQIMGCRTADDFIATMWAEVISEMPVTKTRKSIAQRIHAYRDSTGNAVGHTAVIDS